MSRTRNVSLRSKSLLFVAGYTLALEGSVLAFFYYSGRDTIERRSREQVRAHAALARSAVERALADSLAELEGLRAQLLLYPAPAGPRDAALKPIEQLVLSSPQKYAEVGILDRATKRMFAVRAVSELSAIYPVVEERRDSGIGICPARACVLAMAAGPREEQVQIVVPLAEAALVAYVHLDAVLEPIGRLAAPPGVSALASNPRGLILYAADVSLLRTYLPRNAPGALREQLAQPEVMLTVRKDESADFAELRLTLLRIASVTAAVTLLAFAGVWALTSRMVASLRHLAEVADQVAGGDFSRKIDIRRNDELGLLIDSFNGMTTRLEASYRELSEVNLQLQAKIAELTRTRRRLSEKQRLAVVGEAISKISHEIQNKIGGAGVWVQNLERYGAKDENTSLCIRELKSALASFLDMLVHFKRFYREPALARRSVSARELIDGCLERVRMELEAKSLTVRRDLDTAADALDADPGQMADALVNLLLNAAYFSPEGGTVFLALRRENGHAVFSLRDQGPGLPAKARLFRPFYTTRPAGSGLGLAIVRNIVHAHSGQVRGYNSAEGGACFEIRLPVGEP